MKKVIFVCLLSLAVCLSKPAEDKVHATQPAAPNAAVPEANGKPSPQPENVPKVPTPASNTPGQNSSASNDTAHVNNNTAVTQPSVTTPKASSQDNAAANARTEPAKPDADKITPEAKPDAGTPKDTPKKNDENGTKGNADNQNSSHNGTKPDDKKVVPNPDVPANKPSEAPNTNATEKPVQGRSFDGPSFIGGIILALGLLAIGFMGFKYYKNQTERNYHTL